MQRSMYKDQEREPKPLIDDYAREEFDQRICYAMEFNLAVKLTVWDDGFPKDVTGRAHYIDPITHQIRIEVKCGEFERIAFETVIGVAMLD